MLAAWVLAGLCLFYPIFFYHGLQFQSIMEFGMGMLVTRVGQPVHAQGYASIEGRKEHG
jgi:hypothetical protein